ncbi:phage portal protein [Paraburkholderia silviterrae]|uniref:Phage portal protein n=1 Tax=Paraburkholderia silviterrae TaxID=2528715 RepID=A0A4R5ME04_9BURK|nr:phage portal protein [Paraburkholderia silviterrae]TDG25348.1 phage portal protein [Paraburkholderia silviterrae]
MTAHAYIQYDDVPEALLETALRHRDTVTGARLIAFDNSPFSGEISETSEGLTQIEFAWPHSVELRHALGDWLTYYGIDFTVVM